jgi:hypothetical protein
LGFWTSHPLHHAHMVNRQIHVRPESCEVRARRARSQNRTRKAGNHEPTDSQMVFVGAFFHRTTNVAGKSSRTTVQLSGSIGQLSGSISRLISCESVVFTIVKTPNQKAFVTTCQPGKLLPKTPNSHEIAARLCCRASSKHNPSRWATTGDQEGCQREPGTNLGSA